MDRAVRHLAVLDPKTMKYDFVETCYSTHHPQFGYDANDTLWTSGGGPVVGWLDTKKFSATGDAAASQGWTALVLDINGNGKRDDYVEPDQPVDPTKDKRINSPFYAVMPNPADGSIWGATLGVPGAVVRLVPGSNPPETALAEVYTVPAPGFGARGADIDSKGVVWVSLGSGHIGQLRSAQVQGAAERPEGHRRPLPRRAGRSTSIPAPGSRASATTAPSRATTRGSISTTRSASARTCRCRPATSTTG